MRKATVEIDRIKGTTAPPQSVVDANGQQQTLESIYARAGITLKVVLDQNDIEEPPTGPDFDLALLHQYMTQHRKAERSGWYAHVLIVPNIEYAEGWSISRPIGVMYDFRSADLNNMPREGCAISVAAVNEDAPPTRELKYMRTLAHELGHVFNLLHPKHEIPPQPVDESIMNQTGDLQVLGAFPNNIKFDFNARNKVWLSGGPAEFVRPGGKPFADRPDDAGSLQRDEAVRVTPGLTLTVSTEARAFELGEPLYLLVRLRNDTNEPMEVSPLLSISGGTLYVWITTPANREFRFRPVVTTCHEPEKLTLAPGAELVASEPIFFGARGHSFPAAGTYKIRAAYHSSVDALPLSAVARSCTVDVCAPASTADVDVADALASPSTALYLILRGGKHLAGAEDSLKRIVAEGADRPAAQHAKIAMAAQALAPQSFDARRASELLDSVAVDKLDIVRQAEFRRLQSAAKGSQGDQRGMDDAVEHFQALTRASYPAAESAMEQTKRWIGAVTRRSR